MVEVTIDKHLQSWLRKCIGYNQTHPFTHQGSLRRDCDYREIGNLVVVLGSFTRCEIESSRRTHHVVKSVVVEARALDDVPKLLARYLHLEARHHGSLKFTAFARTPAIVEGTFKQDLAIDFNGPLKKPSTRETDTPQLPASVPSFLPHSIASSQQEKANSGFTMFT